MRNDFKEKVVLVTGGTRGIGLATALAFGRLGARCVLTHRWGSADEASIRSQFAASCATEPLIVEADVSIEDDTRRLMCLLRELASPVEVFVSNVAFGPLSASPADYTKRGLFAGIEYSAWPIVSYTQAIASELNRPPKYIVALSSAGPDRYIPNYDLMACAKAVLETLSKYLAHHYGPQGTRVNVLRAGMVHTDSLEATVGTERVRAAFERAPHAYMRPDEIADAILALCSGWMDGVSGQVIDVDRGVSFDSDRNLWSK